MSGETADHESGAASKHPSSQEDPARAGTSGDNEAGKAAQTGQSDAAKSKQNAEAEADARKKAEERARRAEQLAQESVATAEHQVDELERAAARAAAAAVQARERLAAARRRSEIADTRESTDWLGALIGLFIVIAGLCIGFVPYLFADNALTLSESSTDDLRIFASALPEGEVAEARKWRIAATVLFKGKEAADATVYTVIRDDWGSEHSSTAQKGGDGKYTTEIALADGQRENAPRAEEVEVIALVGSDGWFGGPNVARQ